MRHTPTQCRLNFGQALTETETSYEIQHRQADKPWGRFDGSHDWDEAKLMYHRAERYHPNHQIRMVQTVTRHEHAVVRHIV